MHTSRVIPDRSSHASNVEFVLLEIAGISILSNALQLCIQFLKIADRVGR